MTIEGDAADFLVAVDHGRQGERLGHGRTRGDGAALAGFQTGHALVVVAINQGDLDVLDDGHQDALDRFLGLVLDVDVEADLLAVVEELAVERQLQVQLAARESEALGHHRARLLGAGRQRSVLHLFLTNQIINFFSKVSSLLCRGSLHTLRMAIETDERLWERSSAFSPTKVMKSYSTPTNGMASFSRPPSCKTMEAGAVVGSEKEKA